MLSVHCKRREPQNLWAKGSYLKFAVKTEPTMIQNKNSQNNPVEQKCFFPKSWSRVYVKQLQVHEIW